MKNRKKILLVVAVGVCLIAVIVLGFLWPLASQNGGGIFLPVNGNIGVDIPSDIGDVNRQAVKSVEITKQNVKNVIAALQRPKEYTYKSQIKLYFGAQSGDIQTDGYVRANMSAVVTYAANGKAQKQTVLTRKYVYIWSPGSKAVYKGAAGDFSSDDASFMPTYEKITMMPQNSIKDAGLSNFEGQSCIFIETQNPITSYSDIYYISVDTGLLCAFRSLEGEKAVCEVKMTSVTVGGISDAYFMLPTGAMPE